MRRFIICNLHPSTNIFKVIKSRRMRQAEYVARMVQIRNVEGKRPFGEFMRKRKYNIRMYVIGLVSEED
jgi:hypothetical protein